MVSAWHMLGRFLQEKYILMSSQARVKILNTAKLRNNN